MRTIVMVVVGVLLGFALGLVGTFGVTWVSCAMSHDASCGAAGPFLAMAAMPVVGIIGGVVAYRYAR